MENCRVGTFAVVEAEYDDGKAGIALSKVWCDVCNNMFFFFSGHEGRSRTHKLSEFRTKTRRPKDALG